MLKKSDLYKVICFSVISAVLLISGCSTTPKELLLPESKLEMDKAEVVTSEGKRMIYEGDDLIDEGEGKIDEGKRLIRRGKRLREQGKEKVRQGELIQKEVNRKEEQLRRQSGTE